MIDIKGVNGDCIEIDVSCELFQIIISGDSHTIVEMLHDVSGFNTATKVRITYSQTSVTFPLKLNKIMREHRPCYRGSDGKLHEMPTIACNRYRVELRW